MILERVDGIRLEIDSKDIFLAKKSGKRYFIKTVENLFATNQFEITEQSYVALQLNGVKYDNKKRNN